MWRWPAMPRRRRRSERSRPTAAADVVVRLLGAIAAQGREARAADVLRTDGIGAFRAAVAGSIDAAPVLPPRPPAEPIGRHPLRDGSVALGVALPFGHAHANALERIGPRRRRPGVELRCGRRRAARCLLIGVAQERAAALAAAAERLGFIVRADDPRRRIVACPGARSARRD